MERDELELMEYLDIEKVLWNLRKTLLELEDVIKITTVDNIILIKKVISENEKIIERIKGENK